MIFLIMVFIDIAVDITDQLHNYVWITPHVLFNGQTGVAWAVWMFSEDCCTLLWVHS